MPDRIPIFTTGPEAKEFAEDRAAIFTQGRIIQGLPPATSAEIQGDKASRIIPPAGTASGGIPFPAAGVEPLVEGENNFVNSAEFQQLFAQYAADPESVSKQQQNQVEMAMDLFPELRPIAEQIAEAARPEATIGPITVGEAEKSMQRYADMMADDTIKMADADLVVNAPIQMRPIIKMFTGAYKQLQAYTDNFMANISSRDEEGRIPLEKQLEHIFQQIGLEALDPDDAFFEFEDPRTGEVTKVPMSKGAITTRNFLRGVARLPGELIAGILKDPIGFYLALPEFVGGQFDLLVQSAFGTDIIINESGDIGFRAMNEKEQDQATKELMTHPHGPALAAMLFTGTTLKLAKTGRIITTRQTMMEINAEFVKAQKDLKLKDAQLTEALRRRQEAERIASQKKERRPVILDESLDELKAIEKASEGELRSELLAMQKDAVSRFSAVDIAKMPIEEIKFVLSRGELGIEPGKAAPAPEVTAAETKVVQDVLKLGEKSELVKEGQPVDVKPAEVPEAKGVVREQSAETAARILKIRYDGQRELPDGRTTELFTDPKTGTTFEVSDITEVSKKLQDIRTNEAEIRLQADRIEAESKRLESERRAKELATIQKEADPDVQRIKLEIAEVQDKILEQESTRDQFKEALPFADKASRGNIEAAIESIDGAIGKQRLEIDKMVDQLTEARRSAEAPVEELEKKAVDEKVDQATEAESDVIAESKTSNTAEEREVHKSERIEKVQERQKAEGKADLISEDTEAALDAAKDETVQTSKGAEVGLAVGDLEPFTEKQQFKLTPRKELSLDPDRFQGRENKKPSQRTVQNIVNDFQAKKLDIDEFDPVRIWKDPKDGKTYVLNHSRIEAADILGFKNIPTIEKFFKTEAEAIFYAKEWSNRMNSPEGIRSDVESYRRQREQGVSREDLERMFEKNATYYDALSYLNPGGKVMDVIEQRIFTDFPNAQKFARKIGELRKQFTELTNTHEQQIWDQLYPTDRSTGLFSKLGVAELENLINQQVSDAFWAPEMPIKLRYDPKPMTGTRAAKDTAPLERRIDDLKRLRAEVETPEEVARIDAEIKQVREAIGFLAENQMGLELGFMGTPQAAIDLWIQIDKAIRETGGYLGKILDRHKMTPELRKGFEGFREAMLQHHRNWNNGKLYEQVMAHQFKELIPDKARQRLILDILQIEQPQAYANHLKKKGIIIDPADFSIDQLSTFEQGILTWLRKERDRVQEFKIDNDLVTPRKLPPGVAYAFQWWMNTETGKPFGVEYGRFTKSLPQAKERTFMTYLEGRLAGKEMVTENAGLLIGKDFEMALRANAGRELFKTLNDIELGTGQILSDVPEIAQGILPGIVGERPAMFVENWLRIKESALADEYVAYDLPEKTNFLVKPIKFKDSKGRTRTLQGRIAIHESIAPWVKAYFDQPTYNKLTRAMMFAKSMKLAGIFHASQLVINDLMMLRNPIGDILRARKIKYDLNDPTIALLNEEGLIIEGYTDLGWDPVENIKWEGKGKTSKIVNTAVLGPIRILAKFTFHTVGNNLKVAMAYDQFHKLLPVWEKKVGPDLTMEQARRNAAREAVKFSDNLFSHEDFRLAMLESGRAMVNFYYSTTARTVLHSLLISPQWQKQHIEAFAKGVKSLNPVQIYKDIRNGTETPSSNLYRRYMAGIAGSFAIMNAYNYAMTLYMDGEGKFVHENPEGHGFHVRAPFNHPDGTTGWIRPFKTAFEIPEALVAAYKAAENLGQTVIGKDVDFDAAELSKFTNKMNPWFAAYFANFKFDVDQFGNKIYERRGLAEKLADFTIQVYEPITLSQFAETAKRHKAPIGAVLSVLGFPVSKGYPGGKFSKQMRDIRFDERLDDLEKLEVVDDKIIAAMNGDDEALGEALLLMQKELNMGPKARMNRLQKFWNPLVKNYNSLGPHDRAMWYLHLQETGQLEEFLEAIAKDLGD